MDEQKLTQVIEAITRKYKTEVEELRKRIEEFSSTPNVTEYTDQTFDLNIQCELSLDVIKSIPEFDGSISKYVAWRQATLNAIKPFTVYQDSLKLFQAVCMIRNKIVGNADTLLASHGTPLNLDAIIARLDFAYSDKRPIHVLEQELSMLRQGRNSILEFYNKINQKLTLLTNKNIMTYGDNAEESRIYNNKARQDALRVFITGLNEPLSSTIFSLSPPDLPTALAKTQELISNKQRYRFAATFDQGKRYQNYNTHNEFNTRPFYRRDNQNFQKMNNQEQPNQVEPMEVDPSTSQMRRSTQSHYTNNHNNINQGHFSRRYVPQRNFFKHKIPEQDQSQIKKQRINHMEEESVHFLG